MHSMSYKDLSTTYNINNNQKPFFLVHFIRNHLQNAHKNILTIFKNCL